MQDERGDNAFWTFETRAFERQSAYDWEALESLATEQDVQRDRVRSLATAKQYKRVTEADRQNGVDRGVTAKPTMFVNGEIVEQWTYDNLARAIDDAR